MINLENPSKTQKPVFILAGPTAIGKTNLALELAQVYPFEIISVDSAQVYIDMNVGTAKASKELRAQIPHHLIDLIPPTQAYSVGSFLRDCELVIYDIFSRNKLPLITGGTMLYVNSLLNGIHELPPANLQIREDIKNEAKNIGWEGLHQKLMSLNKSLAQKIKPTDKQRISRALEMIAQEKSLSTKLFSEKKLQLPFRFANIFITANNRENLRKNIKLRWQKIIEQGIVEEIIYLQNKYKLTEDLPSMRSIGYRQMWQYLSDPQKDLPTTINIYNELAINATAQFAKRQMTWINSLISKNQIAAIQQFSQLAVDYELEENKIKSATLEFIDKNLNL